MRISRQESVVPGLPHHVILRGNNRRRIFSYPCDHLYFLSRLAKAMLGVDCRVHALALMANHVHLLATPATVEDLSRFVQSFAQAYAMYRNRSRGATGKLFEQRFDAKPVQDDAYLERVTIYIDSNPLRAGLVDDPLDQPWTTYGIHAGRPDVSRIPLSIWTPSVWYSGLAATAGDRAVRYGERFTEVFEEYKRRRAEEDAGFAIEAITQDSYTRRLMRPDGSHARDAKADYAARKTK